MLITLPGEPRRRRPNATDSAGAMTRLIVAIFETHTGPEVVRSRRTIRFIAGRGRFKIWQAADSRRRSRSTTPPRR